MYFPPAVTLNASQAMLPELKLTKIVVLTERSPIDIQSYILALRHYLFSFYKNVKFALQVAESCYVTLRVIFLVFIFKKVKQLPNKVSLLVC